LKKKGWPDPNPKKCSDSDTIRIQTIVKNHISKICKRTQRLFSLANFFSSRTGSRTHTGTGTGMKAMRGTTRYLKIVYISLKIRIRIPNAEKLVDPNPQKKSFVFTTLLSAS
jgi:hypothetical protein